MDDKDVIKIIRKTMPAAVSIAIAKKLEDLEREVPKELYPFLPTGPDGKRKKMIRHFRPEDFLLPPGLFCALFNKGYL
jgi:hypothetical protein